MRVIDQICRGPGLLASGKMQVSCSKREQPLSGGGFDTNLAVHSLNTICAVGIRPPHALCIIGRGRLYIVSHSRLHYLLENIFGELLYHVYKMGDD